MKAYPKNLELNRKLVKILDDLLGAGDWEGSLFLRATSKRLRELRTDAQQLYDKATGVALPATARPLAQDREGFVKVFISLYQAAGSDLDRWKYLLKTLHEQSITRPCYREEQHARTLLRGKSDIQREGYAILYVKESDIIQMSAAQQDRLGQALLTLKEGAVREENIIGFVHANKTLYRYQNGELIPEGAVDG